MEKARAFLSLMETRDKLASIVAQQGTMAFTVRIGPETGVPEMADCSIVTATYSTGSGQGTIVMNLNKKCALQSAVPYEKGSLANEHHYRAKTLPAAGKYLKEEDAGQLQLL